MGQLGVTLPAIFFTALCVHAASSYFFLLRWTGSGWWGLSYPQNNQRLKFDFIETIVDWCWLALALDVLTWRFRGNPSDAPGTEGRKTESFTVCFTATSSCETSSLWCCRRQTFARIEMHSIAPYEWWTMVNPNLMKIVFSALFCTQCLNLFDAIASPLYNCTSVWPPDWRRPGLDLSRGNIPESCVDMRGGVSFLVFLLPRALQRLSDYPPSQMLDGFCLPFLRSHFRPCLSTFRSILAKMSWVVLGIRLRCWPVEVDIYI